MENPKNLLWVEKYRPAKISECVLPKTLSQFFQNIVDSGQMQNMLLCGSAGCGKTTVARAMCEEMGLTVLFLNASENGNIDTLRTTVREFASTMSMTGADKVVILDEADFLSSTTQPALRGFIEEFSANCRFILTCNFASKIIEPLRSRCVEVEFRYNKSDKTDMIIAFTERLKTILSQEKINYDLATLTKLVFKRFPDFRKTLGELQRYSVGGEIDSGILHDFEESEFRVLVKNMKEKNYTEVRKWIGLNTHLDSTVIFRRFYDMASDIVPKQSVPILIMILSKYQYEISFCADPEICIASCFADIMINVEFA